MDLAKKTPGLVFEPVPEIKLRVYALLLSANHQPDQSSLGEMIVFQKLDESLDPSVSLHQPEKSHLHKQPAITTMRSITIYSSVAFSCRRLIIQLFIGCTANTTVG